MAFSSICIMKSKKNFSLTNFFDFSIDQNLSWKSLSRNAKIGMVLLNIACIGPLYISLTTLFSTNLSIDNIPFEKQNWYLFFSLAGPLQLLMTGVVLEILVNFLIFYKFKFAWISALVGIIWIGLNDSFAMLVFYKKYPQIAGFPLAPFVSITIIFGLLLVRAHVFQKK